MIDIESRLRVWCRLGQVESALFDRKVVAAETLAHRGWRLIRSDSEWARSRRLRGRRGERNSRESDDQGRRENRFQTRHFERNCLVYRTLLVQRWRFLDNERLKALSLET